MSNVCLRCLYVNGFASLSQLILEDFSSFLFAVLFYVSSVFFMKYFVFNCSRLSLFEYVLAQSYMILLLKIILLISVLFLMVCLYYEFFDEGANRNTIFTCLVLVLFSISFLATGRIAVSTVKSNIKADIFSINSVSIKKPANLNGDFIVRNKKTKH